MNSRGARPVAEPAFFGSPDAPLFGWLHRAAAPDVGVALLVCNPFGFEEVCAHRSLRQLAQAVADSGIPVLRFDYAGSGNSAGEAQDEDLIARWQDSVHAAIDALKLATGAAHVCLLGVRLGALLAALAAVQREDVAGLIALAPVSRGRAYLRELKLLGRADQADPNAGGASGALESAGFTLPGATCKVLSALDLRDLARAPASRVLIVERDDLADGGDWSAALQRLGAAVEVQCWPGYAAMVDDPQRARTPLRIVQGVVDTLRHWDCSEPRAPAVRADAWRLPALQAPSGSEHALHINVGGSDLFALVHRPRAPGPGPAVLMLNSGSVHAIGPNRLWVHLARLWAAAGVCVMRLDIAGIGDSAPRAGASDNVVYSPHAMADVSAALTWLREHEGATSIHVMGLCSGAYHAFKAATGGLPVASALMINPLTYFWKPGTPLSDIKEYEVLELSDRYRSKLLTLEPWQRLWRRELHLSLIAGVAARRLQRSIAQAARGVARSLRMPLERDLVAELRRAARAPVRMHFVFASNASGYTLLAQQSGRELQRLQARGAASIDFVSDADHTFTQARARDALVRLIDPLMRGDWEAAAAARQA